MVQCSGLHYYTLPCLLISSWPSLLLVVLVWLIMRSPNLGTGHKLGKAVACIDPASFRSLNLYIQQSFETTSYHSGCPKTGHTAQSHGLSVCHNFPSNRHWEDCEACSVVKPTQISMGANSICYQLNQHFNGLHHHVPCSNHINIEIAKHGWLNTRGCFYCQLLLATKPEFVAGWIATPASVLRFNGRLEDTAPAPKKLARPQLSIDDAKRSLVL